MRLQACKHARDLFSPPMVLVQTMAPCPAEYLMLLHHLPAASQNRSYYLSPPLVLSVSRLHVVQVEPPYSTSFLGYTPYLLTNCGNMRRRSLVEDSSGFSLKSGS